MLFDVLTKPFFSNFNLYYQYFSINLFPQHMNPKVFSVLIAQIVYITLYMLRKLDHVFLWILSTNTGLWQYSICAEERKFQWLAMFCLFTLPLVRPAKAKIQMLTMSSQIVTILLKSLLKFLGLYRTIFVVTHKKSGLRL